MKLGDIAKSKQQQFLESLSDLMNWFKSEGLDVDDENMTATLHYGTGSIEIYVENSQLYIENDTEEELNCASKLNYMVCPPYNKKYIRQIIVEMMNIPEGEE